MKMGLLCGLPVLGLIGAYASLVDSKRSAEQISRLEDADKGLAK
jgi:hypothetical protein